MKMEDLKPGMLVRVRRWSKRPNHWNPQGDMDHLCGQVKEIRSIDWERNCDLPISLRGESWSWKASDFEPVQEEDLLYPGMQVQIRMFPNAIAPPHWNSSMVDLRGSTRTISHVSPSQETVILKGLPFHWERNDFIVVPNTLGANNPNTVFKMKKGKR